MCFSSAWARPPFVCNYFLNNAFPVPFSWFWNKIHICVWLEYESTAGSELDRLSARGSYLRLHTCNHQYCVRSCTTLELSFGVKILLLLPRKTNCYVPDFLWVHISVPAYRTWMNMTYGHGHRSMDKFRHLHGIKTLPAHSGPDSCSVKWCSSSHVS